VAQRVGRGIALLFHDCGTRRGVNGQQHAPAALYPRERPCTYCTGGWVGPRAGLDEISYVFVWSIPCWLCVWRVEVVLLKVDKQLPSTRTNCISSVNTPYTSNETPTWRNTVQVLFLQGHSTCFGRLRPKHVEWSSGPNKEMWWLTYNDNTCTSGRCTSFKYSWWWALAPETCRMEFRP